MAATRTLTRHAERLDIESQAILHLSPWGILGLRTSLFTRIGSLQSLLQPILRLGNGNASIAASLALRIGLYLQESGVC